MQLTQFTDIGLRVLIYLSYKERTQLVTISEIAEQFDIPKNHLTKVIYHITKLGWINATRGRYGGIQLGIIPHQLKLGKLIRALEVHDEVVNCNKNHCRLRGSCSIKGLLESAMDEFYNEMDKYTLADAIKNPTSNVIRAMHQSYL